MTVSEALRLRIRLSATTIRDAGNESGDADRKPKAELAIVKMRSFDHLNDDIKIDGQNDQTDH
jgi:hypothetical protein